MLKQSVIAVAASLLLATAAQAETPNADYWKAKASCWADLQKEEWADTHGTAEIAGANARSIRQAIEAGLVPTEQPIFAQKILPSEDTRYGRPQWRADILRADAALQRYEAKRCKTPLSGCLEVAMQSVYENMEETQGARWNHGRPEIDKALQLAAEVDADLRSCETPPQPIRLPKAPEPIAQAALSADVLFAFDSAVLSAAGRQAVLQLVDGLAPAKGDGLRVVGHTDRMGGTAHNARLSQRRADAVKKVLSESVPALRVEAQGVGSTEPLVTCAGSSKAAIACLAPNRRVVIQVLR